jgi:hypothetical protein
VAEFRKQQGLLGQAQERVVLAEARAFAAVVATFLIHGRNRHTHYFPLGYFRTQKQVAVGSFDVAVNIGCLVAPLGRHSHQVGGDSGFAGTALAAGDCDFYWHGESMVRGARATVRRSRQVSLQCPGALLDGGALKPRPLHPVQRPL